MAGVLITSLISVGVSSRYGVQDLEMGRPSVRYSKALYWIGLYRLHSD